MTALHGSEELLLLAFGMSFSATDRQITDVYCLELSKFFNTWIPGLRSLAYVDEALETAATADNFWC